MSMFDVISELRSEGPINRRKSSGERQTLSDLVLLAHDERFSGIEDNTLSRSDALRIIKAYASLIYGNTQQSEQLLLEKEIFQERVSDKELTVDMYLQELSEMQESYEQRRRDIEGSDGLSFSIANTLDSTDQQYLKARQSVMEELSKIEEELQLSKRSLTDVNRAIKDAGAANEPILLRLIEDTLKAAEGFNIDDSAELEAMSITDKDVTRKRLRDIIMRDFGLHRVEDSPDNEPLLRLRDLQDKMTTESKLVGKLIFLISNKLITQMSDHQLLEELRGEGPGMETPAHDEIRDVNMMIEANINPLGWRASFGKPYSGVVKRMISEWFSTGKQRLSYAQLYSLFFPLTQSTMLSYAPYKPENPIEGNGARKQKTDKEEDESEIIVMEDSEFGDNSVD